MSEEKPEDKEVKSGKDVLDEALTDIEKTIAPVPQGPESHDVLPNSPEPFDISPENVHKVVDNIKEKEGIKPQSVEVGIVDRPEETEQVAELKNEFVNSLQRLVDEWLKPGPVSPEAKPNIDSLYSETQRNYFKITGESFDKRVKDEAKIEAEKEGKEIMKRAEFFSEKKVAKNEEIERKRRVGSGIKVSWDRLPDKDMQKYVAENGSIDAGQRKYAKDLEAKRKELARKSINFSADVYYNLLAQGADPQYAKIKGLFSKKISIPRYVAPGNKAKIPFWDGSLKDFNNEAARVDHDIMLSVKNMARARMEENYNQGRQRWMNRKISKMEKIAENVVGLKVDSASIASRDDKAFEKTIEKSAKEYELDALTDEQLDVRGLEIENRRRERIARLKALSGEQGCSSILSILGLTAPEIAKFKKFVEEGTGTRPGKVPVGLWDSFLKKHEEINKEYNEQIGLVNNRKKIRRQQKIEKAIADVREKLAAA